MIPHVPPSFQTASFNCPHCNAFSNQHWSSLSFQSPRGQQVLNGFFMAQCPACQGVSIWFAESMVYPDIALAPMPNPDLAEDIRRDYMEARSIVQKSPRGAAALLRLCIQKLCVEVGEKERDINADIGSLVKKGLPIRLQQALDIVRVVGNESVHPGQMDTADDSATAEQLFALVNLIAEHLISEPKRIEALYQSLPAEKRDAIDRRDKGAS